MRIYYKEGFKDPFGVMIRREALDLGVRGVGEVRRLPTYTLRGRLSKRAVVTVCRELLADNIIQEFIIVDAGSGGWITPGYDWAVEVGFKPGVTDPTAQSVREGIEVLGVKGVEAVETSTTYLFKDDLDEGEVEYLCLKLLANPLIHTHRYWRLGRSGC